MNSKIANLLSENIKNKQIVKEMIMYICDRDCCVEDNLIDLCLDADAKFVTKDMVLEHIDKIKPLCIKYRNNIESVSNIKVIDINNISRRVTIEFTAKLIAWFEDQESADKENSWKSVNKEDDEHKIKGTYTTDYTTYISFKDIDID